MKKPKGPSSASPSAGKVRLQLSKRTSSAHMNKHKRAEVVAQKHLEKNKLKFERRMQRRRDVEELGAEPLKPATIESKRVVDETVVTNDDEEVQGDDVQDEFAPFWSGERDPKIFITTRPRPSKQLFNFMAELMGMIPHVFFYPRESRNLKEMAAWATANEFSHMIVLGERNKVCHRLLLSVLPNGPTAQFKVTNVFMGKEIYNHGVKTDHLPEIVLNNFSTRLGHRLGRFLGSLFPHHPEFEGRTVCTFHNQRDFIFVRHHRYAFDDEFKRAHLQELGPSFTLKLRWLMTGAVDRRHGEYEWIRSKGEEKSKKPGAAGRAFAL